MQRRMILAVSTCLSATLLSACGTEGSSGTPVATAVPRVGILLDAAVEGVEYLAGTSTGRTGSNGSYNCDGGTVVTFKVGGIVLGTAPCGVDNVVTPLTLASSGNVRADGVINRALFLQALDSDEDPSNGITLSQDVSASLAGKSLDFAATPVSFTAALGALQPSLPAAYRTRSIDELSRQLAREHLEDTLASVVGSPVVESISQVQPVGPVTVAVTRYQLQAASSFNVPYEGSAAAVKADFRAGFLPAYGSGLAFKGTGSDGSLEFYGITDRGPNGDGPKVPNVGSALCFVRSDATCDAKVFPAPGFAPSIGVISVGKTGAILKSSMPLRVNASTKITGLPAGLNKLGASGEVPLTDALKYEAGSAAVFSANGLDTESIVVDTARNALWTSDEYGPFIVRIDPATGIITRKYGPAIPAGSPVTAEVGTTTVLPAVLAKRRANRGMEGLALDVSSGKLHGFLQSPLTDLSASGAQATGTYVAPGTCSDSGSGKRVERYAMFTRWVEFDPATETSRMFAYPINCADYLDNRTGNAKLGDLVSLGNGKFLVIEQGAAPTTGKVFNWLMLVEIANATDISQAAYNPSSSDLEKSSMSGTSFNGSMDYRTSVVPLRKTRLLDLNAAGWLAEKAEGLALVNPTTLALINDNDFGLRPAVFDAAGAEVAVDVTGCLSTNGTLSACGTGTSARVAKGLRSERPQRVWLLNFGKPLADFRVP